MTYAYLVMILTALSAGCSSTPQRIAPALGQRDRPSAGNGAASPSVLGDAGVSSESSSATPTVSKPESSEELCASLGFPDPDVPMCDKHKYAKCIPVPFDGDEWPPSETDPSETDSQDMRTSPGPGVWIASQNRGGDSTWWELRHIDAFGRQTSLSLHAIQPPPCPDGAADDPFAGYPSDWHALNLDYPFDYNADGEPELLFQQSAGMDDAGFPGVLLTAEGGHARVFYSPPGDYFIENAYDADDDGRPDLSLTMIIDGNGDEGCGAYGQPSWSPSFIAHSLSDGSFDMSDKVAAAAVRDWCPKKPAEVETQTDILCALLWQSPVPPLKRKFDRELKDCEREQDREWKENGGCYVQMCRTASWRVDLVYWYPPVVLK